jgi:3-isopropylmalate/(R)-2-methylmalate dehydratase small subunit
MKLQGYVWKYGDGVNTDVIFPGKYTYSLHDPKEWPKHALEDLDATFAGRVKEGDIIVAGKNWGCGSSREQAVGALKYAGVKCLIAKSFARIYFRNAINQGVLPIVCAEAVDAIVAGETIEVDLDANEIRCARGTFPFPSLSPTILAILDAGGLIPMLRKKLGVEHLPMPEIKGGE